MKTSVFISYFIASVFTFVTGQTQVELQSHKVRYLQSVEEFWNIPDGSHYLPKASWLVSAISFQEDFPFDTRLIGSYFLTDYYNSGGFSRVKSTKLTVDAYGNVTIYEPEIYVSGSGVVMKPDSPSTILAQFKIFTKTGMIYVDHHQTKKREMVFAYTVDGNAMVWIGEDGERIIWRR